MADKERRINERSLENLKLGAQARYQGKVRQNFSILPETLEWLKSNGNASSTIDDLVALARNGGINSNHTYEQKDQNQVISNSVYEQIDQLKAEVERLQQELGALATENTELRLRPERCPELPDLEAHRDRYLSSLGRGTQSPDYKRAKKVLNSFIAEIQSPS